SHMKAMFHILVLCFVFTASCPQVLGQDLEWTEIENGIWKASVGEPEDLSLLSAADIKPKVEALDKLPATDFPLPKDRIKTKIVDGKTYLQFPLSREEQIYGLGLNFKTVHQRGRIMQLHVDHYGGRDDGR